jgi:small-conductance mechanosensitive channel
VWPGVVEPLATFAVALAAVLLVRHLVLRWVRRRAVGPKSLAPAVLEAIGLPSVLWCLAAAVEISLRFVELPPKVLGWADASIVVFVIVSLSLVGASVAVRAMARYGERQGMPFLVAGLTRTITRIVVLAIGAMSLLAYLNISITPMVTFLGVGGLAAALALQDTLANFFAGIHILAERPIFVGDLVRLESGQEGTVTDIGWRTTRVRTGSNDMVVVPNTKITSGILVNYSLPDRRAVVEVAVLAAHEADPEQVRRIALEEAARVEGVLEEPAPVVLCDPGVLPTHLQFKLLVSVGNRAEQGRIQSEIRLRVLERFRAEGVPLPSDFRRIR